MEVKVHIESHKPFLCFSPRVSLVIVVQRDIRATTGDMTVL